MSETFSQEDRLIASYDALSGNSGKTPLERYSHLLRPEQQVTVILTAAEMAAILYAHEVGIERLAPQDRQTIDGVITELKRVIWP